MVNKVMREGDFLLLARPKSNQQQYVAVFETPFLISVGLLEKFVF